MRRPAPRRQGSGSDRGFALLIVLWTLVPMALLFMVLAASARSDAQLTANLRGAAELEAVADGAIYTTLFSLLQPGRAVADGVQAAVQGSGTEIVVAVENQSGLVNPNFASPELLGALLVQLGADPARARGIAVAIVDWRTPGRRSGRGTKAAPYQAAGLSYGPPSAPFESLGELGDVLGMKPALLAVLLPHLTLYSDTDPDPVLANPVVRAALRDSGAEPGAPTNARTVRIVAAARTFAGVRVTHSAVIRIGPSPSGRDWHVLAWDARG